jgi:LmbE family N-acetylglucosaminyl deacetylase
MEDHMNACRLAVSAAFGRGMQNYIVDPPREPISKEVVIYHAQPHGNRDPLNRLIHPDFFIDITEVMEEKTAMLAEHKSQKNWLDVSQGFNAYLNTMKGFAREMGKLSNKFNFAEGWRRHNPLGFCSPDADPIADLLFDYISMRTN